MFVSAMRIAINRKKADAFTGLQERLTQGINMGVYRYDKYK